MEKLSFFFIAFFIYILALSQATFGLISSDQPEPEYSAVRLIALPGVSVVFDNHPGGTVAESGSLEIRNITVGHHQLSASKKGYKQEYFETDVSLNETTIVHINLTEKVPASLNITSKPSNVKVFVNDQYQGITPVIVSDLMDGTYTVMLELDDYKNWQQDVSLINGENKDLAAEMIPIESSSKTPGFTSITALLTLFCVVIWYLRKIK